MSPTARIEVATVVTLEPGAAFAAFTEEIGSWFRLTPARLGAAVTGISFVPGVGGRLLATRSGDEVGSVFGTVTVWEPGVRLAFDSPDGTEVEVRFEGVAGGTRVTLEHRGLDRLTPADSDLAFRYGPRLMLGWYEAHLGAESPDRAE